MPDLSRAMSALSGLSQSLGPGGAYASIRDGFIRLLGEAAQSYLDGGNQRSTVNAAKRAVVEAYGAAAEAASGGTLDPDDLSFFNSEVTAEFDFVEQLWGDLKLRRAAGDVSLPDDRIEMYAKSMDAMFNELTMRAQKNAMLEFDGDDGTESCRDCQRYKGQQHRAKWWIEKGLIPGTPGNPNYACKGFRCEHYLVNVKTGERFTV